MTLLHASSPIRVVEATTGRELAQAVGLWLRASRVGEPWRGNASDRLLLAYSGGAPVAVAEVQPTQFGTVGIRRFQAAAGADTARLRDQMVHFLLAAPAVNNRRLAAVAA